MRQNLCSSLGLLQNGSEAVAYSLLVAVPHKWMLEASAWCSDQSVSGRVTWPIRNGPTSCRRLAVIRKPGTMRAGRKARKMPMQRRWRETVPAASATSRNQKWCLQSFDGVMCSAGKRPASSMPGTSHGLQDFTRPRQAAGSELHCNILKDFHVPSAASLELRSRNLIVSCPVQAQLQCLFVCQSCYVMTLPSVAFQPLDMSHVKHVSGNYRCLSPVREFGLVVGPLHHL